VLIALQEAKLAACAIDRYLDEPNATNSHPFEQYVQRVDRAQAIVECIVRTFWDFPLVFLKLAHFSHCDDIAEIFSGRLYDDDVDELEAIRLMRELLTKSGKMIA
jgi:hypothetical protein